MSREFNLANLVTPFTDAVNQHLALPPLEKNRSRAMWGGFLFAGCLYAALSFKAAIGASYIDLVRILARLPGTSSDVWWPFAVWAAFFALSLLWLSVGFRGMRGAPRDVMAAVWAVAIGGGFAAALWYGWYLPREWAGVNFLLEGFLLVDARRRAGRSAARAPWPSAAAAAPKAVSRYIRQQAVAWRTCSRRQF